MPCYVGDQPPRVVVIGAGVGGLTAGALLARRGYRVLVLDQALVPGGVLLPSNGEDLRLMLAQPRLPDCNLAEFISGFFRTRN